MIARIFMNRTNQKSLDTALARLDRITAHYRKILEKPDVAFRLLSHYCDLGDGLKFVQSEITAAFLQMHQYSDPDLSGVPVSLGKSPPSINATEISTELMFLQPNQPSPFEWLTTSAVTRRLRSTFIPLSSLPLNSQTIRLAHSPTVPFQSFTDPPSLPRKVSRFHPIPSTLPPIFLRFPSSLDLDSRNKLVAARRIAARLGRPSTPTIPSSRSC